MPENPKVPRDQFVDDVLDAALRNYSRVEPLTGLEQRVLRRLEENPPKKSWLSGWHWSAMGAVGTLAVVALALITYPPETYRVGPGAPARSGAAEQRSPAPAQTPVQPSVTAPPPNRTPRFNKTIQESGGVRRGGTSGVRPQTPPPCKPDQQKDSAAKQSGSNNPKLNNPKDCVPALLQRKRPRPESPPH